MHQNAKIVLMSMLKDATSKPDRKQDVLLRASSLPPHRSAEDRHDFIAALRLAETADCIRIEWKRHAGGYDLQRIRLLDARKLAEFLHVDYEPDQAEAAIGQLQPPPADHWLTPVVESIADAWRSGKVKHNVSFEQASLLNQAVTAILHLEGLSEPLNYRQFGARYLDDSKILNGSLKTIIGKLLKQHYESLQALDHEDVLAHFNLVKMRQPFAIHGPVTFSDERGQVDARVRPYVAVPDQLFGHFQINSQPDYLLTIENWSSFLEYADKFDDNGIILFTAGYPSRRLQAFYQDLVRQASCPLFHWGDVDGHGFQILKVFQGLVNDHVRPHLMTPTGGKPFSVESTRRMKLIGKVNEEVDELIKLCLNRAAGEVEQEAIEAAKVHLQ